MFDLKFSAVYLVVLALLVAGLWYNLNYKKRKNTEVVSRGSPSSKPAGSNIADITLTEAAPTLGVPVTGRQPWHGGEHILTCDVTFDGFLAANTGEGKEGHLVVMTRATLAAVESCQYRGIGWIAGSIYQNEIPPPFGIVDLTKRALCESWQNGAKPSEDWPFLKPESVTPTLQDGKTYKVVYHSLPVEDGWIVNFQMGDYYSRNMKDDNMNVDRNEQAIAFALLGKGQVRIQNIVSTWF